MTEDESTARILQLEAELTAFKATVKQSFEALKTGTQANIEAAERRTTEFVGDRLGDVAKKASTNAEEISALKTLMFGDKDRTKGVLNEMAVVERKLQDFDRFQEEWEGTGGSDDNPGAKEKINKTWFDNRDRNTRSKLFWTILSGGGLTVGVIAFNFTSGAIDKAATNNANKAKETENRVAGIQDRFSALDKSIAVEIAKIQKDLDFLKPRK